MSVVITCYREGELLREAINSVLEQSPQEIIIVNDASPHAITNKVCQDLEAHPGITVIWRQENGGPSVARNHGFEIAKGDVLVPLDADDLLPQNAIRYIRSAFEKFSDADFIHGSYIRQDSPNRVSQVLAQPLFLKDMLSAKRFSLSSNWSLIGTAPLRKSLWESLGGVDASLGRSDLHDLEFWLRAMALPCKHYAIAEVIYIWRKYLGSNSRQITPLSWSQIVRKHFKTYQALGLEYRAYELLLLGSKWLGDYQSIKVFRKKLFQCIRQGDYQLSSLITLAIPTPLFKLLAQQAKRRR